MSPPTISTDSIARVVCMVLEWPVTASDEELDPLCWAGSLDWATRFIRASSADHVASLLVEAAAMLVEDDLGETGAAATVVAKLGAVLHLAGHPREARAVWSVVLADTSSRRLSGSIAQLAALRTGR